MSEHSAGRARIKSVDDLRALIYSLARNEGNQARITHKILSSADASEAEVVLRIVLHDFVCRQCEQIARTRLDEERDRQTYRTNSGHTTVSPKVAATRDWVDIELTRKVPISSWTTRELGNFTREHCLKAAADRRSQLIEIEAEAVKFEAIAEALEKHDVEHIRELPREVLEEVLAP